MKLGRGVRMTEGGERARWLRVTLAALMLFAFSVIISACGSDGDESASGDPQTLNMIAWEGYTEPAWVDKFEEDNNAEVKVTYIGSDDELFAKVRAGDGKAFDLVAGSRANLATLRDAGLIVPLDRADLPGMENVVAPLRDRTTVDGELLAIPYVWGSIPLIYSEDQFNEPPDSWSVVFDDPETCGKVLLSEDAGTSIATAALYLGYDEPYHLTDEQLEATKDVLTNAKDCAKAFYSGFGDAANYFASGEVVSGISLGSLITKLADEKGASVAETIPEEGAIGWVDTWMVTEAGEEKSDLVYAWLNYMQTPEVQLGVSETTNFAPTIEGVSDKLDPTLRGTLHLDDPSYLESLVPQESPQAPDSWEKRLSLWNTIRGQ